MRLKGLKIDQSVVGWHVIDATKVTEVVKDENGKPVMEDVPDDKLPSDWRDGDRRPQQQRVEERIELSLDSITELEREKLDPDTFAVKLRAMPWASFVELSAAQTRDERFAVIGRTLRECVEDWHGMTSEAGAAVEFDPKLLDLLPKDISACIGDHAMKQASKMHTRSQETAKN